MPRFRCGNCNYTFEPKVQGKTPERCPYCSVQGNIFQERSILDAVDDEDLEE